jgi:hypothetical protein
MSKPTPQSVAGTPIAPGVAKRPKPIRVVKGPDGKPRVIRRGMAAFAALQANIPKVLRIGVIQGARIIEERIVRTRETVTIGPSEKNHFVIAHPSLSGRHPLFELRSGGPKGEQFWMNFTPEMTGRVAFPADAGGVMDLAALRSSPKSQPGSRGHATPLTDDCKGKVVVGDTTLLFQFVVPPPIQPRPQLPASVRGGWLSRIEPGFVIAFVVSSLVHVGMMCGAMIPDWPKPTLEDILASDFSPTQMQVVTAADLKEEEDTGDEAETKEGAGAAEDTGQETAGETTAEVAAEVKPEDQPRSTGQAPPRVTIGGESISERQLGELQAKIENTLSLENILGGGAGGPDMGLSEFGGSGGSVTGLQDALAGTVGTSDGGGGGTGYTTLAGNLVEGPAVGTVGAGGTQPTGPAVVPNRVEATKVETKEIKRGKVRTSGGSPAGGSGRMSGDVFRTTLGRKRGAIEACYNNALVRDPTLAGDLTFLIVINQQGSVSVDVERNAAALEAAGVTSCIVGKLRTMNFASSPPQGGDFRVRLPVSFIAP